MARLVMKFGGSSVADIDRIRNVARHVKREADAYRIDRVAAGQAALSASTRRATELAGELDAKYQSKRAEIDAFRTQPVERVMERLGERLEGVTIEIQPWAQDATPTRVKLDQ